MDNLKVEIRKSKTGKGVFAKENILKSEVIAEFDGRIYSYRSKLWNEDLYNHCIQFEEKKWRDSLGAARFINHSCEPNCGIKHLFEVVAMRNIAQGEEIFWDYEMTEDHPYWRMQCMCAHKNCRGVIGAFKNMPKNKRQEYRGYISEWLVEKYRLEK